MFGSEIDFAPLVEMALTLLGTVLSAVAVWVGAVVRQRFKWAGDFDAGQILDSAIHRGIQYARNLIIGADGKMTVQVSNAIVAMAARYVMDKLPETVEHFGLTEDRVREMILARLDMVIDVDEVSGAKPVAPAQPDYPLPPEMPPATG
jgi:hypothetical protein